MIGIYKITNKLNGKSYIGQSIDIKRRWREHKNNIGSDKNPLYLDFKKYGIENFSFEVLEECNVKELDSKEINYIQKFDTYNTGYNLTKGGHGWHSSILVNFPSEIANFISNNSMHLFYYLLNNSHKAENDYFFIQKDFTINKIKEKLHIHPNTIKKYWELLELHGLVRYEGPRHNKDTWNEEFVARKKDGITYYSILKPVPYQTIPRETLNKIQYDYIITEQELKLYLLLAEMQEHFCFLKQEERLFTLADLRELLQVSKKVENNKKIIEGLHWLKSLNLIKYDIVNIENNLKTTNYGFNLISVNYYTDGGEIAKILSTQSETRLSQEIKQAVLKEQLVYFED